MPLSAQEILRAARALLESTFGQSSGSITVTIRDDSGRRLSLSLPAELLSTPEPATQMQADIFDALADGPLQGRDLAAKAGYSWGSHFRENLAAMRKAGLIANDEQGYRHARAMETDMDRHA